MDILLAHLTALGMAFRVTYTDLAHRQRILASSLEPLRLVAVELFTLLAPSESDYLVPLGILAHCLTSLQAASPFFEHLELVFADLPEVWTSVPPMTLPQLVGGPSWSHAVPSRSLYKSFCCSAHASEEILRRGAKPARRQSHCHEIYAEACGSCHMRGRNGFWQSSSGGL